MHLRRQYPSLPSQSPTSQSKWTPSLLRRGPTSLGRGAVRIGTEYVNYVAPGVLLLCAVTGASTTAVTVCQDMAGGIIDRFRALDVPGTAVLAGHVTASLLRNIVSTGLVIAVSLAVALLLYVVVMRTRLGMLIRAGASNREMVGALGINIKLLYTLVFGLGAALAGFAGLMQAPITTVQIGMGENILISAFVVVTILSVLLRHPLGNLLGVSDHPWAAAAVAPTVRSPWLRSIRNVLVPRSRTRRGFSSSLSATPS